MARRPAPLLDAKTPAFGKHVPPWAFSVGAGDGNRTRTVSLGIGLSCLVDHRAAGGAASEVVRGYPSGTAPDSPVGHATGTPSSLLTVGSCLRPVPPWSMV
jgi:hypothetical protein